MKKKFLVLLLGLILILSLAACGSKTGEGESKSGLSDKFEKADMSGYNCMEGYEKDTVFFDVTVKDVEKMVKEGESFVLYAGFANCPWCNVVLPVLNDVATEKGVEIAYLDTRKNPSWSNNMEIDDYDVLVELFGEVIPKDDDGTIHLYVPHIFFVSEGQLVDDHRGSVPSQDSSSDPLTDDQRTELEDILKSGIDKTL